MSDCTTNDKCPASQESSSLASNSQCRLEIFDKLGAPYKTVDISKRSDVEEVQRVFRKMTGAHTVPRVFINGKCVGGGSETKELYEKNMLQPLIENCIYKSF
ncbi:glutaredoxin-2, mitochondrial-like [Centruroides sculpturatus]|uniref:glutaredoxin-2, mitochondrial-like n=1 Tax=Centruroides sculpturatus TaxID=218467 RepID=UPI000C6DB0B8|nr:glutaredoxin-2, mitochondrial-like [Centruroides sculpturatus]